MKNLLFCAAAILAVVGSATAGPEDQLTNLLISASQSSNPSVSFLQGLGGIGDAQLNAGQVSNAIGRAEAQGLKVHPALRTMLSNVSAMQIRGGSRVRIRMNKNKTSVDLAGRGWAHLGREVSFRIRDNGRRLDDFDGFRLSETKNGMSITPKSIVFGKKNGTPIATIDLGFFVGKREIELKPGTKSAELEHDGLLQAITRQA
ncbi:MAG: hypothetical protein R3F62_30925 [Planctomycetota bacterium]